MRESKLRKLLTVIANAKNWYQSICISLDAIQNKLNEIVEQQNRIEQGVEDFCDMWLAKNNITLREARELLGLPPRLEDLFDESEKKNKFS